MTMEQFKNHPEFLKAIAKIRGYREGFTFRIEWGDIPTAAQREGLRIVLREAVQEGLLECVSMETGVSVADTALVYRRTGEGVSR